MRHPGPYPAGHLAAAVRGRRGAVAGGFAVGSKGVVRAGPGG